jgi:hypothetical protein
MLRALVALLVLTALGADAAPRRTRSKPRPAPAAAPATAAAAEPAPAAAEPPPPPAEAPAPRPAVRTAAAAPAPRPAPEAPARRPPPRLGLGLDLFGEGSHMSGGQWINASHRDESFDYSSSKFLSATAWLHFAKSERLRWGPGLRVFGNYAAGGNRSYSFGLLTEAFATGEYGLPVSERFEVVMAGRAGLALLVPGGAFSEEIRRLRAEGASGVWPVPRVGWLLGLSAGARRRMSERISLRADLGLNLERLYLFRTDQEVSGLHFQKNWTTQALRLGLTLGAEFAL